MSEFVSGDEVVLKSGGPGMIIEGFRRLPRSKIVAASCVWFEKSTAKRGVFPLATLKKYDGPVVA
jgi:uncharacterized protein YodC (DUF2158 family)